MPTVRTRVEAAQESDSSDYFMSVDIEKSVRNYEPERATTLRKKSKQPTYPKTLKVSFRNEADCTRFAKLIKHSFRGADKEFVFQPHPRTKSENFVFTADQKPRVQRTGLNAFYQKHWQGMPEFVQENSAWIYHSVKVVFNTRDDYAFFANLVRQRLSTSTKSIYYPEWTDAKIRDKVWVSTLPLEQRQPRHPIYIITRGRAHSRLTSKTLEEINVPYYIVVEPKEYETYARVIDPKKILTLPYDTDPANPTGPGRARNWCRDHSWAQGFQRHWVLDCNIDGFFRLHKNKRYRVGDGTIFRAAEDFVDRYENVWVAGFQYRFFCADKSKYPPFTLNTRIYSCLLIDNRWILHFGEREFLWRERYNEDTILSLDVMENGFCTVQFNAFLQGKVATQTLKGGNTEVFYAAETTDSAHEDFDEEASQKYNREGTLRKSLVLKEAYPEVTRVVERFGRIHHYVDYKKYRTNKLVTRAGSGEDQVHTSDYSMKLVSKT
jgi:hypothetical protein